MRNISLVAVFVDAGYLFAGGSICLTGQRKERIALTLNVSEARAQLTDVARAKSDSALLLRIYWYDGAISPGCLTPEHEQLASTDFIKLRLGSMNASGRQKGVDSLIVTDLIDLARNHAISDAVLLCGDEDVRVAVQIAQSYGVRVHLVGIAPRRESQSLSLIQEADTTTEWGDVEVAKFLSVRSPLDARAVSEAGVEAVRAQIPRAPDNNVALEGVAREIFVELTPLQIDEIFASSCLDDDGALPRTVDGKLLARSRDLVDRRLSEDEKRYLRDCFKALMRLSYQG